MKLVAYIVSCLFLAVQTGCGGGNGNSTISQETVMTSPKMRTATMENQGQEIDFSDRKLIKKGRVAYESDAILESRTQILKAVSTYKGYIASDQEYKQEGRVSNTIKVRIPAQHFDAFLDTATEGVEKFDTKDINVEDVTEEFLDVEARLKTKKELEARYLELLSKAKNVTEILQIERELGTLRSDIESIEGRLKYLQNNVSLSTLDMTFYEVVPVKNKFAKRFQEGFRNGWNNFIWFFVGLTNIWPFVLIIIGLILFLWSRRKKYKSKLK